MDQDVIIIGAGAAGLMCAMEAAKRGRRVLIVDHAERPGEKIRIAGGGRCNFTNLHAQPENYLSGNPRFCRSALARFAPKDFVALVEKHGIAYVEKAKGQLFCDGPGYQITDMLLEECRTAGVRIRTNTEVEAVSKDQTGFVVATTRAPLPCTSLVIATGGKSAPEIGATGFGYALARQFGLRVIEPRPALVPLTFTSDLLEGLSGISVDATVACGKKRFSDALLFTHRGLSGPAILQISSHWREGEPLTIDLLPGTDVYAALKEAKARAPKQEIRTALSRLLPKRLAHRLAPEGRLAETADKHLQAVADSINRWKVVPAGTEGYRTAEVTLGGVNTQDVSSKTFEANAVPGLYFIGEVLDITGELGGFNFQWAWASGFAAGQVV